MPDETLYIDTIQFTDATYKIKDAEARETLDEKEDTSNKVQSSIGLSSSSTDLEYPSAKCVYDHVNSLVGDIESALSALIGS